MRDAADAARRESGGAKAPQEDVDAVKANPALAARFQAKYGYLPEGMSAGVVGVKQTGGATESF